MTALDNARAALAAIGDNANYGDSGIDNRVLTGIEAALRDLIAEHEALTLIKHHGPFTGQQVGRAWVSLFVAGYKGITVEQVHAALEAAYRENE